MTNRIIIIAVIILVILGSVWYLFLSKPATTQPQPVSSGQNPFGQPAGNTSTTIPGNTIQETTQLQTNTGQNITVPDLTAGKVGFPIGTHQFYFVTSNQETQGDNAQFDIVYGSDSSISIGLFKEPLGQARLAAEASLRKLIPLSDPELCTLKITVAVPYQVSQFYAGQNLGLSFCPGATVLPQ